MKKRFITLCFAALSLSIVAVSCSSKDDGIEQQSNQEGSLQLSVTGLDIKSMVNLTVEAVEINTGTVVNQEITKLTETIALRKGAYRITINGKVVLANDEEVAVGGTGTIDITSDVHQLGINLVIKSFSEDFIIEEIFVTGVRTLEGKQYTGGRYFKLTNNTDKVLKTGGLLICQADLLNTVSRILTPDIKSEAFAVKAVLMIPENVSKDVQPGDFIVIADMAQNHRKDNIPAFDLSNADYEYPNLENSKLGQVDNPAVPDAVVIYSSLNYNMFFLHDRGAESFALARFPQGIDKDIWIRDYTYEYTYPNSAGNISTVKSYKILNSWIIDGVNSAATEKWAQNALDASIDSGWTGVGTIDSDPSRYGKSIRRKVVGKIENGKNLYKDTNNSTDDFVRDSKPSLENGIVH